MTENARGDARYQDAKVLQKSSAGNVVSTSASHPPATASCGSIQNRLQCYCLWDECHDPPWCLLPRASWPLSPRAPWPLSPRASWPLSPRASWPLSPCASWPLSPHASWPLSPRASWPLSPRASWPLSPRASWPLFLALSIVFAPSPSSVSLVCCLTLFFK